MKKLLFGLGLSLALSSYANDASTFKKDASLGSYKVKNINGIPKGYEKYIHASEQDMKWWKEAKFGVFVHWDPSCLSKAEISWNRHGERPGHSYNPKGVPRAEYDTNYQKFNPVNFNADEWITMVKNSGAKYLVFTTKHHGGFSMWDSKYSDYDIMSSPFKRDICKELAEAAQKQDVKIMWYFSQPDWKHPDYWTENHDKFIQHVHNQLEELTTKYGRIDGIWFDGLGKNGGTWDTPKLLKKLRETTPGILINNRMHARHEKWGDFETPEQTVGAFQIDSPWESCISMGGGNWSWMGRDYAVLSHRTSLRTLISCAGDGGNLLLNTGPRPDGKINPPEAANFLKMGQWLKKYGESIYATKGGPYMPGPWGVSTNKGNKIYLHIMQDLNSQDLVLPALPVKIAKVSVLTGGTVNFTQTANAVKFSIQAQKAINTVLVLDLEQNLPALTAIPTAPEHSLSHGAKAIASSENNEKYAVGNLVGANNSHFKAGAHHKSAWTARWNDKQPWVEIDLGSEQEISQIQITEYKSQCRKFVLAAKTAHGEYEIIHEGTYLEEFSKKFKAFKAQSLKLQILEREHGTVQIKAFYIY
jgi:alpha-L-fucosidase